MVGCASSVKAAPVAIMGREAVHCSGRVHGGATCSSARHPRARCVLFPRPPPPGRAPWIPAAASSSARARRSHPSQRQASRSLPAAVAVVGRPRSTAALWRASQYRLQRGWGARRRGIVAVSGLSGGSSSLNIGSRLVARSRVRDRRDCRAAPRSPTTSSRSARSGRSWTSVARPRRRGRGVPRLHIRALLVELAERTRTPKSTPRVALRAAQVGDELGLSPGRLRDLAVGGLLHDIGKLAVPDSILKKPGPLTDDEYQVVMQHVYTGPALLRGARRLAECTARPRPPRAIRRIGYQRRGRRSDSARRRHPRGLRRVRRAHLRAGLSQGVAPERALAPAERPYAAGRCHCVDALERPLRERGAELRARCLRLRLVAQVGEVGLGRSARRPRARSSRLGSACVRGSRWSRAATAWSSANSPRSICSHSLGIAALARSQIWTESTVPRRYVGK